MRTLPQQTHHDSRYNQYGTHMVHQHQPLVDRLTSPSTRQKITIYVHPFNSQNYADFVPVAIRSDTASLHKVLDMIQRVKGAKCHSRVVGLYHYQDRSRIYNVSDIVNGEHVIYVCHGEVQAATSYASSQSSEGSIRQPRQKMRGQIRRDNSFEGLARKRSTSPIGIARKRSTSPMRSTSPIHLTSKRSSSPILQLQSTGSAPSASFGVPYQPHSRKSISSEDVSKPSKLPSNLANAKRIYSSPQPVEVAKYQPDSPQTVLQSNGVSRALQHIPSSSQSVASDQISLAGGISQTRDHSSKGNVQRFLEDPQNELFPTPMEMQLSKAVIREEDIDMNVDKERNPSFSFDVPIGDVKSKMNRRAFHYANSSSSSLGMDQIDKEVQMQLGGKNLTAAEILQKEPLYSEISLDIGIAFPSSSHNSQQTSFEEEDENDVSMNSPFQDSKMPVIHEAEEEGGPSSPNILTGKYSQYSQNRGLYDTRNRRRNGGVMY